MNLLNLVALAGALYLVPSGSLAKQEEVHSAEVGLFVVKWHRASGGDEVDVFEPAGLDSKHRSELTRVFKYIGYTYVESVTTWFAPIHDGPSSRGIMLTTIFSTGSGKEFVIIGETTRGIHEVFKGFSDKIGDGRTLEMVDLDGDGYAEIILVPTYVHFQGKNPGTTRAQVWKWNDKLERYVKVRESAYADRLQPLKSQKPSS